MGWLVMTGVGILIVLVIVAVLIAIHRFGGLLPVRAPSLGAAQRCGEAASLVGREHRERVASRREPCLEQPRLQILRGA